MSQMEDIDDLKRSPNLREATEAWVRTWPHLETTFEKRVWWSKGYIHFKEIVLGQMSAAELLALSVKAAERENQEILSNLFPKTEAEVKPPQKQKVTGYVQPPLQPQVDFYLQFFTYAHLPVERQGTSKPFGELAQWIAKDIPDNAEKIEALKHLLRAKDCAVRAGFAKYE